MRSLSEISKDLDEAIKGVESTRDTLDKLNKALGKAQEAYDNSLMKASGFRNEMNEILDVLVPNSMQGRIRQAS